MISEHLIYSTLAKASWDWGMDESKLAEVQPRQDWGNDGELAEAAGGDGRGKISPFAWESMSTLSYLGSQHGWF